MNKIICPECGAAVPVDDSTFAAVLEQVRTTEFAKEIDRRMDELREQFKNREEAVRSSAEKNFEKQLSGKESQLGELRSELVRLQGIIDAFEATKKFELSGLKAEKDKELFEVVGAKDRRIAELEQEIANNEQTRKVAVLEERNAVASEIQERDKRIIKLESELKADRLASKDRENQLQKQHELQLHDKQAEIERLRDYRLRLSTKMVGETLEQHCSIKFEEAQCMGQFPNATFEKDNIAVEGTKGDFIFRDYVDGEEYVSIMFEMKNEMDTTATKHRNDDFLEKLDKDRHRKNCEYAILVSMLEQDNELYNNGIVDKSHRFPKMIVIRPQFFMPVLRIISEGARTAYQERYSLVRQLESAKSQSADFSRFEEKINNFRTTFNNNITAAHKKFVDANEGIDKVIKTLEKQIEALRAVKENFDKSEKKLLRANELADENLTVKKLTHGIPSIRKMIESNSEI
ncbi:MAG: DUF2130 domain-containing protein [Muribaculaceae bacterium]|nr:DUF2130 domain-containing protein [Muribaculaceae bacterium]